MNNNTQTSVPILQEAVGPVPQHPGEAALTAHPPGRSQGPKNGAALSEEISHKPPPHPHITPACPALLTCSWSPQRDLACSSAPSPAFPALPGGYPAAYAGCWYRSQTGAPGCSLWHLNSGSAPAAASTWSPIPYSAAPGTAPAPEQEVSWAGIIPQGWDGQRRDWE